MAGEALGPEGWASTVVVRADRALVAELLARRADQPRLRSVSVTDLTDLRTAYWRLTAPVEPTAERRAVLSAGREEHVRIGHALAPARFREIRLHRAGIVGQIDLLEDRPIELKTTHRPADAPTLRRTRPAYLEQLGMYGALAHSSVGRLVLVERPPDGPVAVDVYEVSFRSLEAIERSMTERAALLRAALDRRDPHGLPACAWRGRGCEFETAQVCDCTGGEGTPGGEILAEVERLEADATAGASVAARLAQPSSPPAARRFRDLVYPRRAYFERSQPPETSSPGAPARWGPAGPDDLYRQLAELLDSGPVGESTREPPLADEPLESVACFQGRPILLKVSRAWNAEPPEQLLLRQPQYFLELGLRCAAIGADSGRLLIGYERAVEWKDKLVAYDVRFEPPLPTARLLDERRSELAQAVAQGDPGRLPRCPSWMVEGCPYRAACGCGDASPIGRTNR